jgi:hypothetical protein
VISRSFSSFLINCKTLQKTLKLIIYYIQIIINLQVARTVNGKKRGVGVDSLIILSLIVIVQTKSQFKEVLLGFKGDTNPLHLPASVI